AVGCGGGAPSPGSSGVETGEASDSEGPEPECRVNSDCSEGYCGSDGRCTSYPCGKVDPKHPDAALRCGNAGCYTDGDCGFNEFCEDYGCLPLPAPPFDPCGEEAAPLRAIPVPDGELAIFGAAAIDLDADGRDELITWGSAQDP